LADFYEYFMYEEVSWTFFTWNIWV